MGYPRSTIDAQLNAKKDVRKQKQENVKSSAANVKSTLSASLKYAVDLAQEKGASTWLTALPLDVFGFSLHKDAFKDALALRYGWLPSNVPSSCACGSHFTVEHSLSCPKGGFHSIRHNEVRHTIGCWLSEVCSSAATVSDLVRIIRIFNIEICNRTDFFNYRSSSDFACAHVL